MPFSSYSPPLAPPTPSSPFFFFNDTATTEIYTLSLHDALPISLQPQLVGVLRRAHAHRGASFVEVFQNCVVFNDGAFDSFTAKDGAADTQIHVEHGKPLIFGTRKDRGLRLTPGKLELEVVTLGEGGVTLDDVLKHDETNRALAHMLVELEPPAFPVALGVIYCNPAPSFETETYAQARAAGATRGTPDLAELLTSKEGTWTVT